MGRYFPTQAFNLAFKDTIKAMFPRYNNKTDFWKFFGTQLASGGMAGAASLTIVYPLDYARTRLASDVGSGKAQFNGLADCLKKTATGPGGFISLYNGYTPSVAGIIAYRGAQFGLNDTIMAFNPYAKVLKTEGFGGMYKGALANVFRGVGASLVLVLYGEIKLALERGKAAEA